MTGTVATKANPRIVGDIVPANPKQLMSQAWRWVIETGPFPVAVRIEWEPSVVLADYRAFTARLEEVRDAEQLEAADEKLAAYSRDERRRETRSIAERRTRALRRNRGQVALGRLGGPDDGTGEAVPAWTLRAARHTGSRSTRPGPRSSLVGVPGRRRGRCERMTGRRFTLSSDDSGPHAVPQTTADNRRRVPRDGGRPGSP